MANDAQMNAAAAQAWTAFWQAQGAASRCCDHGPPSTRQTLDDHWRSFAARLPPGSRVLDVGCGSGAVGRALIAAAPLLRVTGIDLAAVPPSEDRRFEILSNTSMESLQMFAVGSFDAAVSQYGYEYGNTDQAAEAIARVLVPGAPISFLVHHEEGPIVVDSGVHRRALEQLCGAELRAAFMSGDAALLDRELASIRQHFPGEGIIEQAGRGLRARVTETSARRAAVWNAVADALAPELIMLGALEACSVAPHDLERWLAPLAERFEIEPPAPLATVSGEPLAWKIEGRRR